MENQEAKELLEKYKTGRLSTEEHTQLESWYLNYANASHDLPDEDKLRNNVSEIWENLSLFSSNKPNKRHLWFYWAAAIALIISTVGIYMTVVNNVPSTFTKIPKYPVIKPGSERAFLILSSGEKIDLTKVKDGQLASENGMAISKNNAGELLYTVIAGKGIASDNPNALNTIYTPRGGNYRVLLPDGTKIWLNSASSLTYPLRFNAKNRSVRLEGQGYFQVAPDKDHPFIVLTDKQTVTVLGTNFDINAYNEEEAVQTTLLHGSVRISTAGANPSSLLLIPGQRSELVGGRFSVNRVDTAEAVAWKNGYFKFNGPISGILRQLSRWYDVDIVNRIGDDSSLVFGGEIARHKDIRTVLNIIEATGNIHFKIEGRRVIVTK